MAVLEHGSESRRYAGLMAKFALAGPGFAALILWACFVLAGQVHSVGFAVSSLFQMVVFSIFVAGIPAAFTGAICAYLTRATFGHSRPRMLRLMFAMTVASAFVAALAFVAMIAVVGADFDPFPSARNAAPEPYETPLLGLACCGLAAISGALCTYITRRRQ